MAWLLLGGIGFAAVTYIGSKINDAYEGVTKPINNYIEETNKDALERDLEEKRQLKMDRTIEMHKMHNEIRDKYKIKKENTIIKLTNNTENVCDIIYVNHYNANDKNEAISWAEKVLEGKFFEGGVLNKRKTKRDIIGMSSSIELIKNHFEEYFIVVHTDDNKYFVLDKNDAKSDEIKIKNKFNLNNNNNGVDFLCKW